uniref:hypothetical protein n=1 Tax=Nitrospira cf. moscoviensis SBR1015 TaxID=96242 RepID=UPI001120894F|nr:hypothetical protein [Nitrospira cf. moscoviensis SBR1015]
MPKLTGAVDAPVKTLWIKSSYGQTFVDFLWQRRDMVFTVNIFDEEGDPERWKLIDSRWRFAFDYVKECTIRYTEKGSYRDLKVRLLEEPKAYESGSWEGKDPHLYACSTVVMTVAAQLPFYVGPSDFYDWEGDTSSGHVDIELNVDCDVPVWPKWTLTDQARWRLPDFSWGNNDYGTGLLDMGRTVLLPYLPLGAGCVADSDPRKQTLLAANRINLQGLWGGKDLLYPILGGTYDEIPVSVSDAVGGFRLQLEIPKWYSRPWSRPVGLI